MQQFNTVLHVTPKAKQRPRATMSGQIYTPQDTVTAEAEIRYILRQRGAPLMLGPLALVLHFVFLKPKSAKKSRIYPVVGKDLDNLVKIICDAGNKLLWQDDRQIITLHASKTYGVEEHILLDVREIA